MFVRFAVRDGEGVLEGDISLGPIKHISRTKAELEDASIVAIGTTECLGGTGLCRATRWDYGIVPYVISSAFSAARRDSIVKGMRLIDTRAAGVFFRPKQSYDTHWITFVQASECSSKIGRFGGGFPGFSGSQEVKLTNGCAQTPSTVAHEAFHALGVRHEQARCDRDNYLQVLWQNIAIGDYHNFDKQCSGHTDYGAYHPRSVMHYGSHAFSTNDEPTLVSLQGALIGPADTLMTSDWQTINQVYLPWAPTMTGQSNVGGFPSLSFTRPFGIERYDITLVKVYEEYNDYVGTFTTSDVSNDWVGSTTTGELHDITNAFTGEVSCTIWSNINGSASHNWKYEVTPWFSGGVQGQIQRHQALVADCASEPPPPPPPPPPPTYSTTILGPTESQPGNTCTWNATTNAPNPQFEWRANGVTIGNSQTLYYASNDSFTLSLHVTDSGGGGGSSQRSIAVSQWNAACFDM